MSMSVSRILYDILRHHDSHLSGTFVAKCLKRHFRIATDTALHSGKSFAVSLPRFHGHIPEGTLRLSALASLLASHGLLRTGVTRYLALRLIGGGVFGLSSNASCETLAAV